MAGLQHSIFIGYRRDDTGGDAGRIYDRLEAKFGDGRVFKDVDSIPRGVKFRDYVPSVIGQCQVFLALVGPRWIDIAGDGGARRLDDPEDLVRIEIETALATPGVQLIPVLVAGAPMPRAEQLPASLRALAEINAAQMRRDPDFNVDIGRLIRDLERGMETGRVVVEAATIAPSGSAAAAWKLIADSMDVHDYTEFQTHFPGTPEVILAGRRRRFLETWNALDQNDPQAIVGFRKTLFESGFDRLLKHSENVMNTAQRRVRESQAAEAEAQRKAEEEARAKEERYRANPRLRPGAVWRDAIPGLPESACPEMVTMPTGKFLMGSPSSEERWQGYDGREEPQHEVRIDYAFALGKHTVTFAEWDAAIAAGAKLEKPGDHGWGRDRRPVINVSWEDAKAYIDWLNGKLGLEGRRDAYRLPSEAEWEYACRAGTTTPFSFGATISTVQANYDGDYTYGSGKKGEFRQKTTPVGSFPANTFGLHDMHGNVWEWCEDVWHDNYAGAPSDGSAWVVGGDASRRVLRGGSWGDFPNGLRSAFRVWDYPSGRLYVRGFRLARTVSPR